MNLVSISASFSDFSSVKFFCEIPSTGLNFFRNFRFTDESCFDFSVFFGFLAHVKLNFAEKNEIELSRRRLRWRLRLAKSFFSAAANLISRAKFG